MKVHNDRQKTFFVPLLVISLLVVLITFSGYALVYRDGRHKLEISLLLKGKGTQSEYLTALRQRVDYELKSPVSFLASEYRSVLKNAYRNSERTLEEYEQAKTSAPESKQVEELSARLEQYIEYCEYDLDRYRERLDSATNFVVGSTVGLFIVAVVVVLRWWKTRVA